MIVINARNVHAALPEVLERVLETGQPRGSRNGRVLQLPEPLTVVYRRPWERVLFWAERDANPFFHLAEALWMLAGRQDLAYPAQFVSRMRTFSDDGETLHGAYGYRWRRWFGRDQLDEIVRALRADHLDRRQVLQMWDARADLGRAGRDVPCNTQATFQVGPSGALDMVVFNRSNDIVWGLCGANAVHFSVLHEYLADRIGVTQGTYTQVSANAHVYADMLPQVGDVARRAASAWRAPPLTQNPYEHVRARPLGAAEPGFSTDLERLDERAAAPHSEFFRAVVRPMTEAHRAYRHRRGAGKFRAAREALQLMPDDNDWRRAAEEWLERRAAHWARANDDGVRYED